MKNLLLIALSLLLFCKCDPKTEKQLTDQEKHALDSISKFEQRRKTDSMRQQNPMLIIPPDSTYTGDYIDKYGNGIVKFRGFFRQGERHGQWMSFYPNGLLWSEMHYDKGLREGPNATFFEDGKKRYEGFYKNDKRDSIWCYYDSTGKMAQRVIFKDDRVIKQLPLDERK